MSRTMRLGGSRPSCHRMVSYVFDGGSMRLSGHRANPDPNLDARLGCLPVRAPSAMPGNSHPIVQGADSEGFWRNVNLNCSRRIALSAGANLDEEFRLRSSGWTGSSPYCSSKKSAGAEDIHGPVAVDSSSVLEEDHFHELADDVLHHLQDKIEVYGEDLNVDGFDLDHSSGVLTVRLGNLGTYVINKQTPNRQIWLSSPMSGPGRFDWSESKSTWIYRRNDVELVSLLEKELSELLGAPIHLSSG